MTESKPPRRAHVIELLAEAGRPLHVGEIASKLGVSSRYLAALDRVIDDLVMDTTIAITSGARLRLNRPEGREQAPALTGVLSVNPRGFGFVTCEGRSDDLFIAPSNMKGAMHGDSVEVRVIARSPRGQEGEVTRVVARRKARVAATLERKGKSTWAIPEDPRVRGPIVLGPIALGPTADGQPNPGRPGDVVIVDIEVFPESPDELPTGVLVKVLGRSGDPEVEVQKILALAAIDEGHPRAAVLEAQAFGETVTEEALVGREDLTHLPLPTIDPEDARDHDDAVWAVRTDEGYRVWVAIADVSHYVTPGSALDAAACERGCSIYLPDRAIPMLPRELSSNLCSLLPSVIRLCFAVEIDLDASGTVLRSRIFEGFMRSAAKLTYERVAFALGMTEEKPAGDVETAIAMRPSLEILREVSTRLRARRMARGALDFDLPETKMLIDPESKRPVGAKRRTKDPGVQKAYQLIEELMLLANETVARFVVDKKLTGVFRNHALPDPERVLRFESLCQRLGIELEDGELSKPSGFKAVIKRLEKHPKRQILDSLLVRSLKQAVYEIQNIGHFGLASDAYLHFTSPIRRYPDLLVHRAVRAHLRGGRKDVSEEALSTARDAAKLASERERKAMQIERDVVDAYATILMSDHVGDRYGGTIVAIVSAGLFVQLEDPFLSVLVRWASLGSDGFEVDEDGFSASSDRSGETVSLGDSIEIEIEEPSMERRTVYARRIASSGGSGDTSARTKGRERSARPRADEDRRGRGASSKGGRSGTKKRPRDEEVAASAGPKSRKASGAGKAKSSGKAPSKKAGRPAAKKASSRTSAAPTRKAPKPSKKVGKPKKKRR